MKKVIYLLIASLIILSACHKDQNVDELNDLFFGDFNLDKELLNKKLVTYNYFTEENKVLVYYDGFISEAASMWKGQNTNLATTIIDEVSQVYHIRTKGSHVAEAKFIDFDQERDFQIELVFPYFKIARMDNPKPGFGVVYNRYETTKQGKAFLIYYTQNSMSHAIVSQLYDFANYSGKKEIEDPGVEITMTIRKVENQVSYFLNEKFMFKEEYTPAKSRPSVGYYLAGYSVLSISNIIVEYLN